MAYSDYGGYAYRNGERVVDRSDFTILPGGGVGTPGAYPGFAAIAAGATEEQVKQFIAAPHHHVVLGDGPIMLGLHKQSGVLLYRVTAETVERLPFFPYVQNRMEGDAWTSAEGVEYFNNDPFLNSGTPVVLHVDDVTITIRFTEEDNYYVYAKLEQADGTIWTGFSGYGVGAGLEDCGYGFSTDDRESQLQDMF